MQTSEEIAGEYIGSIDLQLGSVGRLRAGLLDIYMPEASYAYYPSVTDPISNIALAMLHEWTHAAVDILTWVDPDETLEQVHLESGSANQSLTEWIARYAVAIAEGLPVPTGVGHH